MNTFLARVISVVCTPLLAPVYGLVFLLLCNPFIFGYRSIDDPKALLLLITVTAATTVIPGLGIFLLKPLGLISDWSLREQKERTGPYIIAGVFFLWLFQNLASTNTTPLLFRQFILGGAIGLFLSFFINLFLKVSVHAVGVSGLAGLALFTWIDWKPPSIHLPAFGGVLQLDYLWGAATLLVLAGLTGSARLAIRAHTVREVWVGYAVGMAAWILARFFYGG
ncbi:MAG: hypothetical protein ACK4NS_01980 [Saprospiraceae bacterium]